MVKYFTNRIESLKAKDQWYLWTKNQTLVIPPNNHIIDWPDQNLNVQNKLFLYLRYVASFKKMLKCIKKCNNYVTNLVDMVSNYAFTIKIN